LKKVKQVRCGAGARGFASISISSDGTRIAYACGSTLELLDADHDLTTIELFQARLGLEFGHVGFSPDQKYLAVTVDGIASVMPILR
jgi:hypothetical protein